jgi:predicted ATPase
VLDRELSVAPLESTTQLYEAIKEHRAPAPPAVARTAARVAAATHPATLSTAVAQAEYSSATSATVSQPYVPAEAMPLVGRAREWEAVLAAYHAGERRGCLLVIEGELGVGKTRLADELAIFARRAGSRVLGARCYEGEESLAFAPISAMLRVAIGQDESRQWLESTPDLWLSEAARLLPELRLLRPDLPAVPRLESTGAQCRFFEGLRQVILGVCVRGSRPGVLICDDVHWADHASLEVLAYLSRRMSDLPLCLVLTWRSEALGAHALLHHLLADALRVGCATHVHLERMSQAAVTEWIEAALDRARNDKGMAIAERLIQETEGLPLFVAEYVRALTNGALSLADQSWAMPGGVQDLLRSRLGDLGDANGQILTAASILGHSFAFDLIREVSGRSEEEAVTSLEGLSAHGLIREVPGEAHSGPSYDFSHEKLRTLVYEQTSLARRRLLHRRAAVALEQAARRPEAGGALAAQIAWHHLAAGDEASAANSFKLAGEHARALYANTDALRHLEQALALGHPDRAGLHEAIGDVQTLLGAYVEALASYESASAGGAPEVRGRIEHKLGEVCARRGEWEYARCHLKAALDALVPLGEAESAGERARIYADMSLIERHRSQLDEAQVLAERALALATEAADGRALAQAHNILGILASSRGEGHEAVVQLERSLLLAEHLDDATFRAAALNNLALALSRAGDLERAHALAEGALTICVAQGDRHHEAALHNNVADLLHVAGRHNDAMAHLKQAVAIYAEIGVEAGMVQPEIWKLAEW